MALIHSFENSGNYLFRRRGYLPVFIVLLVIPVMIFTDYSLFDPSLAKAITVTAIVISLTGFMIRAWAVGTTPRGTSGRNTKNQVAESLNTTGIYSILRHPLYLGNYLMWAGIMIFSFNVYLFIISGLLFWIYYERIMFAEERFLEKKYGRKYLDWSMKVPAFIPSFGIYKKGELSFSLKTVLRREYSGVLATVLSFAIIDYFRHYLLTGGYYTIRISLAVTALALLAALILRSLKHYTRILDEEDRS